MKEPTHLDERIANALEERDRAQERLEAVVYEVQEQCDHKFVLHSEWAVSDWGSVHKARRICLKCRLEEEAANSGWGDYDGDFAKLKTCGFHKTVSRDEIYNNRLR